MHDSNGKIVTKGAIYILCMTLGIIMWIFTDSIFSFLVFAFFWRAYVHKELTKCWYFVRNQYWNARFLFLVDPTKEAWKNQQT